MAAPGEVATYSCDEAGNYTLVGEATRLCLPSLVWEGEPPGCTNLCGNGAVDPGETCDGDCPTRCEVPNLCQKSALGGSPEACNVACGAPEDITVCIGGDGCCPAGCTLGNDYDCSFSAVVVGADFSDANVKAIADALLATGLFTAVDWVRVPTTEGADYAPIAASIAGRRAVFAYTASVAAPDTVDLMGDLLADYFDLGGRRLVLAAGANCHDTYRLRGRFETDDYHVLAEGGLILTSTALGTVFEPNSPLLQGVPEDLALEYTCDAPLLTGARAIANWETGRPLAAVRSVNDSNRVDLNIFVGQGVGNIEVPGVVTLIANALRYPLK